MGYFMEGNDPGEWDGGSSKFRSYAQGDESSQGPVDSFVEVPKRSRILKKQHSNKCMITYTSIYLLVGGLEHEFYFPRNIGLLIIPIDSYIFQRGGPGPPTRLKSFLIGC